MATTSPINGLPAPDDNSPNDPPVHFIALNNALDDRLNARFPSTATRDAAIPTPTKNSECWIDGLGKQINTDGTSGGWVTVGDYTPWPRPFGRLTGTTTQSVADDGAFHAILLNNQDKLVNMAVNLSVGQLKATTAGWYQAFGSVNFAGNSGGRRIAGIMKNGTLLSPSQNTVTASVASTLPVGAASIPVSLAVNDYVQVAAFQDSGGALSVDRVQSFVSLTFICPI